jgi:YD repeat-containing protein
MYLQNTYDQNGRVIRQVTADGAITTFDYTQLNPSVNTSPVDRTIVTDPRGSSTTYNFSPAGSLTAVIDPLGEKTVYYTDTNSFQVTGVVDPLGRATAYAYDIFRNIAEITRLAGTPGAATILFTYSSFNRLLSIE